MGQKQSTMSVKQSVNEDKRIIQTVINQKDVIHEMDENILDTFEACKNIEENMKQEAEKYHKYSDNHSSYIEKTTYEAIGDGFSFMSLGLSELNKEMRQQILNRLEECNKIHSTDVYELDKCYKGSITNTGIFKETPFQVKLRNCGKTCSTTEDLRRCYRNVINSI